MTYEKFPSLPKTEMPKSHNFSFTGLFRPKTPGMKVPFDGDYKFNKKFRAGYGWWFSTRNYRWGFFLSVAPWERTLRFGFGSHFLYVGWIG